MCESTSAITTVEQLEERLARPTSLSIEAMRSLDGDLLILGAGGKMGPSLARLARRSAVDAGRKDLRVIAASRFSSATVREQLQRDGIEVLRCDLLDPADRAALPRVPNVLFMFGHKFSRDDLPGMYWAMNVYLPGLLAEQYRDARIVCFSSGNVYPFTPVDQPPPTESTPPDPVGEYANSVLGRERMLQYVSARHATPVCLLRLNYAVEARYGVLVDLAQKLRAGEAIDLTVPEVNIVWQGYANAAALAAFQHVTSPAAVLNLTGLTRHRVRDLATALGKRLGIEPAFTGPEGDAALVSDASRCHELFGPPNVDDAQLVHLVAGWLRAGGETLGKPTKFQVRDGKF